MAIYYVSKSTGSDESPNDGSSGAPWKTLRHAYENSTTNDTIRVRNGAYFEELTLAKNGQTWEADSGHSPSLDGNWGPILSNYCIKPGNKPSGANYKPGDERASMVKISGTGIVWDGIDVNNIAGVAFAVTGDNWTIKNCNVHFIYSCTLTVSTESNTGLMENVDTRYVSMKRLAIPCGDCPGVKCKGTQTAVIVKGRNITIKDCTVKYCYGEGISADKGSVDCKIIGNRVEDTAHGAIYANAAIRPWIEGNIIIQRGTNIEWVGDNKESPATCILLRDEDEGNAGHQYGQVVINNIAVGGLVCFAVTSGNNNQTRLDGAYVAHNLFVNPDHPRAAQVSEDLRKTPFAVQMDEKGLLTYRNSLFENNIILVTGKRGLINPDLCKGSFSASGVTFRNNTWYSVFPDNSVTSKWRGDGDTYTTDPKLANPMPNFNPEDISANNWKLTASSGVAINSASDGSAVSGVTIVNVNEDFFGASRPSTRSQRDRGPHEFGGTVDPIKTLDASFTIDDSEGQAPHAVTVTDTSTVQNDTIDTITWEWGDGSADSTGDGVSHTYLNPGIYTIRQTVTTTGDLIDSFTATVKVLADPGDGGGDPGDSNAVTDVKLFTMSTTANQEVDLTFDLSGQIPRWAIFALTNATATDSLADDGIISLGLWGGHPGPVSGPDQACAYVSVEDDVSNSNGARLVYPGISGYYRDIDTLNSSNFVVQSVSANTIKIKTSSVAFPAGYKLAVMVGSGANVRGQLVYWNPLGQQDETITPTHTVDASFLIAMSSWSTSSLVSSGSELSIGLATASNNQRNVYWGQPQASTTGYNRARLSEDRIGFARYQISPSTENNARVNLDDLRADGANISIRMNDILRPFFYLAVETDAPVNLRTIAVPTNVDSPTVITGLGFAPAAWIALPTTVTIVGNHDDETGGIGIAFSDGTDEYTVNLINESAQTPHDTKSEMVTGISARKSDGSLGFEGSFSAAEGSYEFDVSSAAAAAYRMVVLTIGGTSGGGTPPTIERPTAFFSYSPETPLSGQEIEITDLSNGNGETITEWAYDFGDGGSETSAVDGDVTHIYSEAGTYTITLQVTTVGGTSSSSKTITVLESGTGEPVSEYQVYGPPFPQDITSYTKSKFVGDPNSPQAGFLFLGLDLSFLPIEYNVENLPALPGQVAIGIIDNDLVIRRPDGAIATVPLTFELPAMPIANFSAAQTTIIEGNSVTFTNSSTDYTSSEWNFGDGSPASLEDSPSHTYSSIGTYTVRLTVYNSNGDESVLERTNYITVVESLSSTTVEVQIAAITDDGRQRRSADSMDVDVLSLSLTASGYMAGYRWSLPVPQGSTIESAYLKIYLQEAGNIDYNVTFEDIDNAPFLDEADADNLSTRTMVSATAVAWQSLGAGAGWHTSPDISTVLQEVVDRVGYAENNYVLCRTENLTSAYDTLVRAYKYGDGSLSAKLEVTYS